MNLNVGQIGVKATPIEAVRLARQHGYGAVTPMTGSLSKYSEAELGQLLARRWASPVGEMKSNGIVWGAGVLSPFFEPNDTEFKCRKASPSGDRLTEVRRTARLYQQAGVTRCFTPTMSSSNTMTYLANFRLHTQRVREVGKLLADHGLRVGIEYLGTKVLAVKGKFPFIRTSAQMKELTKDVGLANVAVH
jgi:hypothetical protein